MSLTVHLPFQNVMNDRKRRCLPFLLKYFVCVWEVLKRFILRWFEHKERSRTGMTVADCVFLLAGLENSPSFKLTSEQL